MTSGRVRGGQNQYGFTVGILMLDTRFPRIPGDMGNAGTFPFPVRYHRVQGAGPDLVVRRGAEGLLPAFVDGARQLEREGVGAITTNCGFLIKFQRDLAAAVKVPVFTSSLLLGDEPVLDVDLAREEHVRVARRLVAEHPDIGALVLECTNMPPYTADIQRETGLPVFDIVSLVTLAHRALATTIGPRPA